ncbi:MAG: DEAD/DEAH box helicase [Clostridia bacterium]|nr:DEAD/DEAH box helicase [Clostridia bacterium]MBT7121404.1 DEAD/DEAH box helicase [Clostridia bacterium]
MKFTELGIIAPILKALEKQNYSEPTPIQQKAIVPILQGRDILGSAQTGTGKTAAFAVPTLQRLSDSRPSGSHGHRKIRSLILTPTRELALQIYESFLAYGHYTGLRACVVFGGVSQKPQEHSLKKGVDILVATPGRLDDLMNQGLIDLSNVEILTLDEADRMLDMGFIRDVKKIIVKTPKVKQTLLFSATMPPEIAAMSKSMLNDPVRISIAPETPAVEAIEQYVYFVDRNNKRRLLLHLLKDPAIVSLLVFTRTKHGADRVARELIKRKINAQAIHGDKSQGARQQALRNFKNKQTRVLVATDIAARGLDIEDLSHVINFDLPNISETYVHRIGRTGRAGKEGISISFCDYDEIKLLMDIEKLTNVKVTEVSDHPYPMLVLSPRPKPVQQQRRKPAQNQQRSQKSRQQHQGGSKPSSSGRGKLGSYSTNSGKPSGSAKSASSSYSTGNSKSADSSSNATGYNGSASKSSDSTKSTSGNYNKRTGGRKPPEKSKPAEGKYVPRKSTAKTTDSGKLNPGKYKPDSPPKPKSNPGRYNQ